MSTAVKSMSQEDIHKQAALPSVCPSFPAKPKAVSFHHQQPNLFTRLLFLSVCGVAFFFFLLLILLFLPLLSPFLFLPSDKLFHNSSKVREATAWSEEDGRQHTQKK